MKRPIRVLVSTRLAGVIEQLEQHFENYTITEAFTTATVRAALGQVDLAIVDVADLVAAHGTSHDAVAALLANSPIPHARSDEFLADPRAWRERALAASGSFAELPPRRIVFTSYSGGVGKTTLALDTALHFAAHTHRATALLELTYGPSALRAVTGVLEGADFFSAATQHEPLAGWRGVGLVPFDYDTARGVERADAAAFAERVAQEHVLTVVDTEYPHPFFDALTHGADIVFVLASPKPDAWANAARLREILTARADGRGARVAVIFNLVDGLAGKLAQVGLARELDLPRLAEVRFDGALAKKVLPLVYPGWRNR